MRLQIKTLREYDISSGYHLCLFTLQMDVCQWLRLLTLDEYDKTLTAQGYTQVEALTDITWEDLEDIGIKRLGTNPSYINSLLSNLCYINSVLSILSDINSVLSTQLYQLSANHSQLY